jgi:hypothetical protein
MVATSVEIGPHSTSFRYAKREKSVGVDWNEVKRQALERADIYSKLAAAYQRAAKYPWWYVPPKPGPEPPPLRFSAPTAES